MTDIEELREIFERMKRNTGWDHGSDLLWGYFFTHSSRGALDAVAPVLQAQGYRLIDVYLSDKEDPAEPDLWWLHVEKVETHSPESLFAREERLTGFATKHDIEYDGWEVGPVGPEAAGNA